MTLYLIKKGWHYSINWFSLLKLPIKIQRMKKHFGHNVTFMFGEGCDQVVDQINKLYGHTLGWFIHRDSVRVGWKWDKDFQQINLYAYYYLNGERKWVYLCDVKRYEEYSASIRRVGDNEIGVYIYKPSFASAVSGVGQFNEEYLVGGTVIIYRHLKKLSSIKWKLFPYFGGKEKAKQDIRIYLHER